MNFIYELNLGCIKLKSNDLNIIDNIIKECYNKLNDINFIHTVLLKYNIENKDISFDINNNKNIFINVIPFSMRGKSKSKSINKDDEENNKNI